MDADENQLKIDGSRSLLSGSFIVAIALLVSTLSQFAFMIVIAHRIGESGVGLVSMTLRTVSLLQMIAVFGTPAVITRMVAAAKSTDDRKWVLSSSLALTIPLSLLLLCLLLIISGPLAIAANMPELTWLLLIFGVSLPFTTAASLTSSHLRGELRFRSYAFLLSSPSVISLVLLLFWFNGLTPTLALEAILVGTLFGGTLGLVLTKFQFWHKPDTSTARKITILSLPLLIVGFAGTFMDVIDIIVIGILTDSAGLVGIYTNAYALSTYLRYVIEPFALVLLPLVSMALSAQKPHDAQHVINTAIRVLVILFIPIAITVSVASVEILSILFPPAFISGAPSLSILAIASLGLGFYYIFSRVMISGEKTAHLGMMLFVLALADFFLTILLTIGFGIVGAALSSAFIFIAMGIVSGVYVQYRMKIQIQFSVIDVAMMLSLFTICWILRLVLEYSSAMFGGFYNIITILLVLATTFIFWILVKPMSEEEADLIIAVITSSPSLRRFKRSISKAVKLLSQKKTD